MSPEKRHPISERPGEEPPVRLAPVCQRKVALTLIAGEFLINLVEATDLDLRRLHDAQGLAPPIQDDGPLARPGHRLAPGLKLPERRHVAVFRPTRTNALSLSVISHPSPKDHASYP